MLLAIGDPAVYCNDYDESFAATRDIKQNWKTNCFLYLCGLLDCFRIDIFNIHLHIWRYKIDGIPEQDKEENRSGEAF
jgi:hypothetical protein